MRRLFWAALGAAVGVAMVRQVTKTAKAFTPSGIGRNIGRNLGELGDQFKEFAEDVRAGMAEREHELAAALRDNQRADQTTLEQLQSQDEGGG
jgi:hypothetical protein